jgi:hypothetical protein
MPFSIGMSVADSLEATDGQSALTVPVDGCSTQGQLGQLRQSGEPRHVPVDGCSTHNCRDSGAKIQSPADRNAGPVTNVNARHVGRADDS